MSLPLLRGYPITFSISVDAINRQYRALALDGKLPSRWQTTGDSWKLDAEVGAAYIDLDPNEPQSVGLNFPVESGEFQALVDHHGGFKWVAYKLDGVVFRFLTPTRLLHDDQGAEADLTVQSLFLDLDSPHVETDVETSKAVETSLPDHLRAPLWKRIRAYVQGLASSHKEHFIISTSIVAKPGQTSRAAAGCLEPAGTAYSTFLTTDSRYSQGDPRRTGRSAVNWLFELPFTRDPSSPAAGHFDSTPLEPGVDATMQVAGYALMHCVLLPAVERSVGLPASAFSQSEEQNPPVRLRGACEAHGWVFTDASMHRESDRIQINFAMTRTASAEEGWGPFKVKESLTVNVSWETHIKFYLQGGNKVGISCENKNKRVSHSSSGSILGIPIPSFLNDFATNLALSGASFSGPSIQGSADELISRVRLLGGGQLDLERVSTVSGNLVLGLANAPIKELSCTREGSVKSLRSNQKMGVLFHNQTGDRVTTHWIDYNGKLEDPGQPIPNGGSSGGTTFVTHSFSVRDRNGKCIRLFRTVSSGRQNDNDIYFRQYENVAYDARSEYTGSKLECTFVNRSGGTVQLVWIDGNGSSHGRGSISDGGQNSQNTWVGHVFAIQDEQGRCLAIYKITSPGGPDGRIMIEI